MSLSHSYNGLDDRISTTTISAATATPDTRRFVYAPDGRVLGEYGSSASDVRAEFIWLSPQVGDAGSFGGDDGLGGYMPLAVAANDNIAGLQLIWVHANHMGVPAVYTDASGAAINAPSGYSAPGFPGQSRTLSDLYYNRYRDYDPTTGRYIQADPIGLAGGASPYSYAMNNPLRYTDPTGEMPFILPIPTWPFSIPKLFWPKQPQSQPKSEYGTYSCKYYTQRCNTDGGLYYCSIAPTVCAITPDTRWSRCVRKCLQETDYLYCKPSRYNYFGGSDVPAVINIHQMCWQECVGSERPKSTIPPPYGGKW